MTVELQEAPTVGVGESVDVIEMVAHVYWPGTRVAWCGLDVARDAHRAWHRNSGDGTTRPSDGYVMCEACGVPICPVCQAVGNNQHALRKHGPNKGEHHGSRDP